MLALGWLKTIPLPTLAAVVLVSIAYGLGGAALRALKLRTTRTGVAPLASLGLGLGILATSAYALGASGLLGRVSLRVFVLAAAAVAIGAAWSRRGKGADEAPLALSGPGDRVPWNLDLVFGGALFLFGFAYATLPPYYYDALTYHLALPARYLATGSIAPPPNFAIAGYPQNGELLSAIAISLGGENAAQIFNYFVAWAGIAGLWWFLRSRTSRVAASVGLLLVIAPWPFWFISTCCKNDPPGAVFLLGAFALLAGGGEDTLRRAVVAGCLAGFGVGTKYTNVFAAPALLLAVPFVIERGSRAKVLAGFTLALVVAAAPWPARNAVAYGNPVYPIFGQTVGSPRLTARGEQMMKAETGQTMSRAPLAVVHRLSTVGVDLKTFDWAAMISPILLPAMLLGAIATRRRDVRAGLVVGSAVLIVGVACISAEVQTFPCAWCLGALAPAALLERATTRTTRALVLLLFGLAVAAALVPIPKLFESYSAHGSGVFAGTETPAAFAERHSNYLPLALGPISALPRTAVVMVVGSTRAAFLPRAADWSYVWDEPPLKTMFAAGIAPDGAVAQLRARGVTHLLVNGPEMARLERMYDWLGLKDAPMNDWFTAVLGRLSLVATANGCDLYVLPAGAALTGQFR